MPEDKCTSCIMEPRIRALEIGQNETSIYVKEIREDLKDIKTSIKNQADIHKNQVDIQDIITILKSQTSQDQTPPEQSNQWSKIVMELIKLATTCVVILGAIVGAVKLLGK